MKKQVCEGFSKIFYPSPVLKNCIKHYVVFCFPSYMLNNQYMNTFPSGGIELYLHLGKSRVIIKEQNIVKPYTNLLFGLFDLSNNTLIKSQTDDSFYRCILISINIHSINYLIDIPLNKLKNRIIDLVELWDPNQEVFKFLNNENSDVLEIISSIDNFLVENFSEKKDRKQYRINKILTHCLKKEGRLTVDELARDTKTSYRTIYRAFTKELGMCPKEYLRIIRFHKVCNLLKKYPFIDWNELVYSCGYFDQAHFIHEFKSILKFSPEKFLEHTKGQFYLSSPFYSLA